MKLHRENVKMLSKLVVIVAGMFGFGYAMVPLYEAICEATGVNILALGEREVPGNASKLPANTQIDKSRTITVEFDANAHGPWEFKPAISHMAVHPGEMTTVMYEFRNVQNRTMVAQAIPSYAPMQAGSHFNKLECFCFSEWKLAPGEVKRWPVVFVVDPKLPRDIRTITLSYTFFEVGGTVPPEPAGRGAQS